MRKFNSVLKGLREEKGISQRELAEKLGISGSSVAMYESNKREPDFEMLENIADFFNVDMNYLLGKTPIRNSYRDGNLSDYTQSSPFGEEDKIKSSLINDPELWDLFVDIKNSDTLRVLLDGAKELTPDDLKPILMLIHGIRKEKGLE